MPLSTGYKIPLSLLPRQFPLFKMNSIGRLALSEWNKNDLTHAARLRLCRMMQEQSKINRRDFLIKSVLSVGVLSLGAGCSQRAATQRTTLSQIGVLLIKDLTADKDGGLRARNVVSAMAEAYPRRLYQALLSFEAIAHERKGKSYVELDAAERHEIISGIYTEGEPLKRFCIALIKTHYNVPYRWKVIGYKPVAHKEYGIADPEFDSYNIRPSVMEV